MTYSKRIYFIYFSLPFLLLTFLKNAQLDAQKMNSKASSSFQTEEKIWRDKREQKMRSDKSWLTIAGLYWLKEGVNSLGSGENNNIILPEGSAPKEAGSFELKGDTVRFKANINSAFTIDGKPVSEKYMRNDMSDKTDVLELNHLKMWILKRGDRYALRLRDLNAKARSEYKGLHFYNPDPSMIVSAKLVRYPKKKTVTMATIVGTVAEMESPGKVHFSYQGAEHSLEVYGDDGDSLFLLFKDSTNGRITYGAGRYMQAIVEKGDKVKLNFNRAYNPPCSYTKYATCPVVPQSNFLKVGISAGEKRYH